MTAGTANIKGGGRRNKASALCDVWSPIADELRDPKDSILAYRILPYVPFFEGGDASLKFFERMRTLSTTQGSCIDSIKSYALGGDFDVIRNKIPGLAQTEAEMVEVSAAERASYVDFILSFTDFAKLMVDANAILENKKTYGNVFYEVVKTEVAGQRSIHFHVHDCDECRFLITGINEHRVVLVSPSWTWDYLSKYTPRPVPMYPAEMVEEDGTVRTMIHVKNYVVGRPWYGLPDSVQSLYYQYLEYQQGRFTVDGYANDWTAKVFIETEGDDEDEDDDDSLDLALIDTFTNKGDNKKSFVLRNRTPGMAKTEITQFQPNTNEKFHEAMGTISEKQIIKSHNWHPILFMDTREGLGGNSGSKFLEVFRNKYYTVIKPAQEETLEPIRMALKIAQEWLGYANPDSLTLGLTNIFKQMLEAQLTPTEKTAPKA